MNKSLGIIEVQGLIVAIEIADAMVKAAQVSLIDIEKTNGFGWVTVKIAGDVSSVTAAIETGQRISQSKQKFVACKVLSRPSESLEYLTVIDEKIEKETKTEIKKVVKRTRKKENSKKSPATQKEVKKELTQLALETSIKTKEDMKKSKQLSDSIQGKEESSGVKKV